MDNVAKLVEYIARSLVNAPEEVKVSLRDGEETVTVELTVARDDMGKVIGRQGKIAKAIRTVVRAATLKSDKKYVVEIV